MKLSRFIKVDSSEWGLLFAGQNRTGFFIKVVNTNRRSEGKADECQGFVTVGNKTYRTVWEYSYAGTSIGREALLLVFSIDKNTKKVHFSNYQQSHRIQEPYDGQIDDNVTIRL